MPFIFIVMTQKERNVINLVLKQIESECKTLEELFLQTKMINFRWVKQSLEEKVIEPLKQLKN